MSKSCLEFFRETYLERDPDLDRDLDPLRLRFEPADPLRLLEPERLRDRDPDPLLLRLEPLRLLRDPLRLLLDPLLLSGKFS